MVYVSSSDYGSAVDRLSGATAPRPDEIEPLSYYIKILKTDPTRAYVEWIHDYLGVELTSAQIEMIDTILHNQKVLVVAGNGFGKSYCLACFSLAFLFLNYPASVLATSGTYAKLRRTYCRPVEALHQNAWGLPGEYLRSNPPRIRIDGEPEVFWEAASPGDAGELEGVHNKYTLGVIEEADKQSVTKSTFESMESMITDENDKVVAVANPPEDEVNVVYDIMQEAEEGGEWVLRQYSSFDSHNVEVELNHPDPYEKEADGSVKTDNFGLPVIKKEVEDDMIPEIVRLNQIKKDWMAWNQRAWPGIDEARNSQDRDDLDIRWYRRRMGTLGPQTASVLRPFTIEDVEAAFQADPAKVTHTPQGIGWDVVRGGGTGGDYNALAATFGTDLRMLEWWRGEDHLDNYETIKEHIKPTWRAPFAIDHVGVGSEAPDRVRQFYPNVTRFNGGGLASDPQTYANAKTEAYVLLGEFLRDGGSFRSERLREELLVAARVVKLNENYSSKYDTTRYSATSKSKIKSRLGRSPDLLDAACMAVHAAKTGGGGPSRTISSSF